MLIKNPKDLFVKQFFLLCGGNLEMSAFGLDEPNHYVGKYHRGREMILKGLLTVFVAKIKPNNISSKYRIISYLQLFNRIAKKNKSTFNK